MRAPLLSILISVILCEFSLAKPSDIAPGACSPIDLSSKMGPVRYQDESEWCWAYAGADALGYAAGITPTEQISTLDFAIQVLTTPQNKAAQYLADLEGYPEFFNSAISNTTLPLSETGYGALPGAKIYSNYGYCSEKKASTLLDSDKALPIAEQLRKKFNYRYSEIVREKYTNIFPCNCNKDTLSKTAFEMASILEIAQRAEDLNLKFSDQEKALLIEQKNFEASKVAKQISAVCTPRKELAPVDALGFDVDREDLVNLKNNMAILLQSKTPIIISMDPSLLRGKKPTGQVNHTALISGSRLSASGRCEFKLRNSWECETYKVPKYRENCKDGELWIDEDDMANMVYGLEVVAPQGRFGVGP